MLPAQSAYRSGPEALAAPLGGRGLGEGARRGPQGPPRAPRAGAPPHTAG